MLIKTFDATTGMNVDGILLNGDTLAAVATINPPGEPDTQIPRLMFYELKRKREPGEEVKELWTEEITRPLFFLAIKSRKSLDVMKKWITLLDERFDMLEKPGKEVPAQLAAERVLKPLCKDLENFLGTEFEARIITSTSEATDGKPKSKRKSKIGSKRDSRKHPKKLQKPNKATRKEGTARRG